MEHRLFSFISQNWRAQPLVSYRVIVELISATTTKTSLTVRCELAAGHLERAGSGLHDGGNGSAHDRGP